MQIRPFQAAWESDRLLDDFLQFMLRCIDALPVGFVVAWGVSANTRS